MATETKPRRAHCVVLAYPGHGHSNPIFEFSNRLQHQGITVTLVTTRFFLKNLQTFPNSNITLETISDGFDNGRNKEAVSSDVYSDRFRQVGTQTLIELIEKLNRTGDSVDCVIYDSILPWVLEVAKKLGLIGVSFLTQSLAVDSIFYHVKQAKLQFPLKEQPDISLPGLPSLELRDMPSFLYEYESQNAALDWVLGQFSNIEKADWILCNSFYELEKEVADCMTQIFPKLRTIGPTIPYMFLDNNRLEHEDDSGFARFKSEECTKWLDNQPKGSVVFMSLGTISAVNEEQMEELAWGLSDSGRNFLWVVRDSEDAKLPNGFSKKTQKNLVVSWCHQLEVLSHEAIGCFVTHCGWNSTLEALCFGVPMVAMPQWADQTTNAKHIVDVWKIGVRALVDEKGTIRRETLKNSIWEIMEGEKGSEIKNNAIKWRNLAVVALSEGGSSRKNTEEFLDNLSRLKVK